MVLDKGRASRSVEQRLEFIDYRLFWFGHIRRSDLIKYFGISVPQASADLGRYQELAPNNMVYDPQAKRYVAGLGYAPKIYHPSARQYLSELRAVADGALNDQKSWVAPTPPYSVVPIVRRRLEPNILRSALNAIRENQKINILYRSLSEGDRGWREIAPHALAFDGMRWHARAWCFLRQEFRDFVLARIESISELGASKISGEMDAEWNNQFTLRLAPNPDLSEEQRATIQFDFDMESSELHIKAPLSMTYYIERNLLVDSDTDGLKPERRQLILLNRKDLFLARKIAKTQTDQLINALFGPNPAAE